MIKTSKKRGVKVPSCKTGPGLECSGCSRAFCAKCLHDPKPSCTPGPKNPGDAPRTVVAAGSESSTVRRGGHCGLGLSKSAGSSTPSSWRWRFSNPSRIAPWLWQLPILLSDTSAQRPWDVIAKNRMVAPSNAMSGKSVKLLGRCYNSSKDSTE